ncbi:MAG: hypothetical protein HKN46_02615 [Acidimicrobiia bacterium]|nr:hypothetical protein [Acidimicrobiia bacterium]
MGEDPTKDAWTSVGDQMKDLGGAFKEHYESDDEEGSSTDEVKDALRTVGEGLDRLFTAIGNAVRDPEVQEKAKQTGTSVIDAIGTTLGTVADDVRDVVQRKGAPAEEPATDEETATDEQADAMRELDDTDAVEEIRADLDDEA